MSNSSSSNSGGISFVGLLQILFIGLKLTNYIVWPWWQVLLPTIIYGAILAFLLTLLGILIILQKK